MNMSAGGAPGPRVVLNMLDAVRGGGVCTDVPYHAAAQPHSVPRHLVAGYV